MTAHQRIRGKPFNQQIAVFGKPVLFQPHKTAGPQQELAVNWLDGYWLGFNTRTGEHIVSNKAPVTSCRSIRRGSEGESWNRDMLLGILGNPSSLQDGRVEVDDNSAEPAIPMVNPEVEAGPTRAQSMYEESNIGLERVLGGWTTTHRGVPSQDHHSDGNRLCTREATRGKPDKASGVRQTRASGCCTE